MQDIYNLATKLYKEGRYDDSKILMNYILPHASLQGDLYNTCGMIEQNLNNNDDAKKYFKIASLLQPTNETYKLNLQGILENKKTKPNTNTVVISGHLPIDTTGYSAQTYYLAKILIENNYDVKIIGWNATNMKELQYKELCYDELVKLYDNLINFKEYEEKNPEKIDILKKIGYYTALEPSFPCYLNSNDYYDIIVNSINPKFIIFIQDIYVMKFSRFKCPTISWLPVHSEPLDILAYDSGKKFDSFVALSEFGRKQISEKFEDKLITTIPHIVDKKLFYPINDNDYRNSVRQRNNIEEDRYVCLLISNNSEPENRKAFDVNIGGFADYLLKNDKAHLHIHTDVDLGFKIMPYIEKCGIPKNKYTICDQERYKKKRFSDKEIADLYRMSDVLLFSTNVEGFGLPMLEAQACNCPVIVNNFSTPPEYTKYGVICEIEKKTYSEDHKAYSSRPSRDNLAKALNTINSWSLETHKKFQHETQLFLKKFEYEYVKNLWCEHIKEFQKHY